MKRVFIIHGWGGNPQEGWFPWLKKDLQAKGYQVEVPAMPNPDEPTIEAWVDHVSSVVGKPDEDTFFVGHSIGCQTILRYVEQAAKNVGGAIFVAGWFTLTNAETDEEKRIAKPWIETPIDFQLIRQYLPRTTAIFSEDDPVVPLEANRPIFENELGSKIIIEQGKGHFAGEDGIKELPSVLTTLLGYEN